MIVFVMRKARATQLTIELTFKGIDLQSIHGDRYYNPNPPQS
jgi:superfamily II DNA/RNA helicase